MPLRRLTGKPRVVADLPGRVDGTSQKSDPRVTEVGYRIFPASLLTMYGWAQTDVPSWATPRKHVAKFESGGKVTVRGMAEQDAAK